MRCIKCNQLIGVSKIIKLPCDDLPSAMLIITTCITCKIILKRMEELQGDDGRSPNKSYGFELLNLEYELFSKSI